MTSVEKINKFLDESLSNYREELLIKKAQEVENPNIIASYEGFEILEKFFKKYYKQKKALRIMTEALEFVAAFVVSLDHLKSVDDSKETMVTDTIICREALDKCAEILK